MISADVKSNKNNKKSGGCMYTNFYKKYFQHLKYNVTGMYFSFDFGWYSIHLDIVY